MNTFIQVLFGLIEVLTVLQCSFMSPYTNSKIYSLWNIFPIASRFLHRTGLPTYRSAYRFTSGSGSLSLLSCSLAQSLETLLPLKFGTLR